MYEEREKVKQKERRKEEIPASLVLVADVLFALIDFFAMLLWHLTLYTLYKINRWKGRRKEKEKRKRGGSR